MKIYLDTCSLQRLLASKTRIRIILETEAVLSILGWCKAGTIILAASDVLAFEIERNPNPAHREYALAILNKAVQWEPLTDPIERRAGTFNTAGIKPLDAIHLSSA
jgi:hypothetical protein